MRNRLKSNRGFTLIELMVALALTGMVAAAAYGFYISQNRTYIAQDRVVEMQQNLRSALDIMVRDIRMAGCDPQGSAGAGFITTQAASVQFTMDIQDGTTIGTSDGDVTDSDENIRYSLLAYSPPVPPEFLGLNQLIRTDPVAGTVPVAEAIQAIGFAFAIDSDANGLLDADAGGTIWAVDTGAGVWMDLDTNNDGKIDTSDNPAGQNTGIAVNLADVRAVRIWLLAASEDRAEDFTNTTTYVVGATHITPSTDADPNNDTRRMRLLETSVKCRNMGL